MRRNGIWLILSVVVVLMLGGCGKGEGASGSSSLPENPPQPSTDGSKPQVQVSTAPVTLSLYNQQLYNAEEMERIFVEPVRKKYPHITLDIINPGKGTQMQDLVATGVVPDMFFFKPYIEDLIEMDIPLNLEDLVKTFDYDLQRFESVYLDAIRSFSPTGELLGVPITSQFYALWYNKDIFDKFGVAYPTDGMMWEETIELAKRVTRIDADVQYRGIDPNSYFNFSAALSLPYYDTTTQKAIISDKWNYVFETMMNAFNIPGNKPEKLVDNGLNSVFIRERTLAMAPSFNLLSSLKNAEGLNWDVAQAPSHKYAPNKFYAVDYHLLGISKTSKHKEQAMQVIMAATADDTQLAVSRSGRMGAIKHPQVKEQFAADVPHAQGKSLQSIFKSEPAPLGPQHEYNGLVRGAIRKAFEEVFAGTKDINTALRDAEERANQNIQAAIQAK